MKRILFALCLMVSATAAWAWGNPAWYNPPTAQDMPNETPLTIKLKALDLGPNDASMFQIAAFIDDELRASGDGYTDGFVTLRVMGDAATETGKNITFKVFYKGLVYSFTHTEKADWEADQHTIPITLTLNPLVDVELTNPITVEAVLPVTYNLTNDIKLVYADETATGSTLETELKYTWDAANSQAYIEVGENNILTAKQETDEDGAWLGLNIEGVLDPDSAAKFVDYAETMVIVKAATVPVETISINPTEVDAYVGDDLLSIIRGVTVTIGPQNASNKEWDYEYVKENVQWWKLTIIDPRQQLMAELISQPGTHKVKFSSKSNPEVFTYLTINVKTPLSFSIDQKTIECTTLTPGTMTLTVTGDDFDPSKVSIMSMDEAWNADSEPFWYANPSGDGKTWVFQGKYVGKYAFEVYYNDEAITLADGTPAEVQLKVNAEIPYAAGWNWISIYADNGKTNSISSDGTTYEAWVQSDVIEIRSQTQLLYNDPTLGVFGEITDLNEEEGMYKLKAKNANTLLFKDQAMSNMTILVTVNNDYSKRLIKGYNWFTYPHEFDLTPEELFGANRNTPQEGDMIIGKDNFATYEGRKWVYGDGFKFEAGKGYIYYSTNSSSSTFNMSYDDVPSSLNPENNPLVNAPVKSVITENVWNYDASRFADNMPIIASVKGLRNPEQYSIGAFVGDECRGKGSLVTDDLMFINVAGKAGEKVTFRLYNTFTGEYSNVNETISYSAMAGSMRAPVCLTTPIVTGVNSIQASQNADTIYNLAGQRVDSAQKGIYIVRGKKVFVK